MTDRLSELKKRQEELQVRRNKITEKRKEGEELSVSDQTEIDRIDFQSYEEGGNFEISDTAVEGMEVLSRINDGTVTKEDAKMYTEFMGDMNGRISELNSSITRLSKIPGASNQLAELRAKKSRMMAIRAAVRAGTEGKRRPTPQRPRSKDKNENKPKFAENNKAKDFDFESFKRQEDRKRVASEAVLKLVKEGKDPSKVLRTIGYNEQGNKIQSNENSAFVNMFSKEKSNSQKPKRRSFAELRGLKTKQAKKAVKRTEFDPVMAQRLQASRGGV